MSYGEAVCSGEMNGWSGTLIFPKKLGDVTGDGRVTAFDAALVLRFCSGREKLSEVKRKIADVNGGGDVTPLDAVLILKFVVGLIDSLLGE